MKHLTLIGVLTILCLMPAQGVLSASLPSPWKPVGKPIQFSKRTDGHTLSPDGKVAAWIISKDCSSCNQDIVLYDVTSGKEQQITPPTSPESKKYRWQDVQSLLFSADSTLLAAVICLPLNETCRIDLYHSKNGDRVKEFRYRMRSTVLHNNYIMEFEGNRIKVVDSSYGTYTIEDGKVTSFVDVGMDIFQKPHAEAGELRIWVTPEFEKAIFSTSVLHIGTVSGGERFSLKPGSTIRSITILPEKTAFLTTEFGGPTNPAPGITAVESGGAAYCRDVKDGQILYKLTNLGGISGAMDLSRDGKTLMITDWHLGGDDLVVRFFRREDNVNVA